MNVVVGTDIDAPRQTVWDYLVDPSQRFDFLVGLTRWEPEHAGHGGLGARYLTSMRIGSVELGSQIEVVEFDPPLDLAWSGVTGVDQRGRWRLRHRRGGGTRVEFRLTYHAPGGVLGFVADLVASVIVRRNLQRSLAELKRRLEARSRRPSVSDVAALATSGRTAGAASTPKPPSFPT